MKTENQQNELEYKSLLDEAIKRIDKYNKNLFKAYAFSWENATEQCKIKLPDKMTLKQMFSTSQLTF